MLKSLKRGKSSEQLLACDVLALTFLQLGIVAADVAASLQEARDTLETLLADERLEAEVRAACAKTLALALFVANDHSHDIAATLDTLEALFSRAHANGDAATQVFAPSVCDLHATALSYWALLLCMMPLAFVSKATQK